MHFLWDRQQKCFHDGKPLYISGIPFLSVEVGLVFEAVGLALMTIDFVVHVWWSGGVSMAQLCTAHFRTTEARDYATLTLLKGLTIACSIVEWLVFIIMGPERYSNVFNIRLGGYFRLCLICLYSRHIRTNLRVILLMMPNFLEVVLLLVLFVFFCAWIGTAPPRARWPTHSQPCAPLTPRLPLQRWWDTETQKRSLAASMTFGSRHGACSCFSPRPTIRPYGSLRTTRGMWTVSSFSSIC